jgi:two-component system response regulator GlrR
MNEVGGSRHLSSVDVGAAIDRPSGRRRGDRLVGGGRITQDVVDQAMALARSDEPVLIVGPPGTGKEHVARAIHAWGSRADGPLVVFACKAASDGAASRELFGCTASAYASHPQEQIGALSRAAGGTLLLDTIESLPDTVRQALAKAIADGRFQREGDAAPLQLRARIVATAVQLQNASAFGSLSHHVLRLAPLAERREDILPLAAHFLRLYAEEVGVKPVGFTAEARNALVLEDWPGNVRELSERVRQAIKLAGNGAVSAEALLLASDGERVPSFKEAKRAFETRYVTGLLRRCNGNISRAARLAKKDRKDFYDVIRRTGVDPADFR